MPENNAAIDQAKWSGEGEFTQVLIEHLRRLDGITLVRVEDAPASRSEADYNLISNEIFVAFATIAHRERTRRFGVLPATRLVETKALSLPVLEQALAGAPAIGAPDYSDDGMLQY